MVTKIKRTCVRTALVATALIASVAIGEAASAGSTFYVSNHGAVKVDTVNRTASGILRVARTSPDSQQKIGCWTSYSTSTAYSTTCSATDASTPAKSLVCSSTSSAHAAIVARIGSDSHVFFNTDPASPTKCQTITVYTASDAIK